MIPHPSVTVVLPFGSGTLVVADAAGRQQRGSLVAALGPCAIRMRGNGIECVEVRMSPVVAHTVLGFPLAALGRGIVSVDELWGREGTRTAQRLGETGSWAERFALVDTLLARRRAAGPVADPEVEWTWQRLVDSHGLVKVDELAGEVGWSRKRLWSRFRQQIGVPPKHAAKLVRFDRAVRRLALCGNVSRVAVESGYFDQAHFHREVLALTGMTPARLAGYPGLADHDPV
ncbi:helix-turn-helix domain-containing protein [Nocardia huaxiensis]|uniref:helix-turn-helix domain-containing protein n=1 Tax=Nocardia huaxiensis TaxID=2755382 RepID=UPI001E558E23|nr:helix-turn-helix domain-containing protein [Nocardia huaxiensis]UFS98361.1 helix-turn-helix domain-containing protein [Nocardia huaxiensis]